MASFKDRCVALRKNDKTLPEITRITGRPKTSVWFHIQNIPLSHKKQKKIAEESKKRIAKYGAARKGKSDKEFKVFDVWSEKTILLVSHLIFDGETRGGKSCIYNNRSEVLIKRFEQCMKSIYQFDPKRYTDHVSGVHRVSYHNVALGAYIENKKGVLLKEIQKLQLDYQKLFLRAFYDDEGCIDFKSRQVRGYQHNYEILQLIHQLLDHFEIESKIDKKYNEIIVSRKENLIKFRDTINFSKGVRINGERKNSIWKKNLEKREILDMAINSYQS